MAPLFSPAAWGTLYQLVPWGIIMPIYSAVYLWTSPIARISASTKRAELLSMEPVGLIGTAGALVLGYVVPTILAALPCPSVVSLHTQQLFLAIWQFFPLLVAFCRLFLSVIVRNLDVVPESARQTAATRIMYARRVYRYVLGITSAVHFSTIAFAVFPSIRLALFAPTDRTPIYLKDVVVPMSVFSPRPVQSMAEGALSILQYDLYFATAGGLLWVTYMSYASSGPSVLAALKTVVMSLARSMVVGPGGAVLWAIRDRDDQALSVVETNVEEKKTQ